jgi:1-acyl-sn-glycerol-3-phosphate acyltransferase
MIKVNAKAMWYIPTVLIPNTFWWGGRVIVAHYLKGGQARTEQQKFQRSCGEHLLKGAGVNVTVHGQEYLNAGGPYIIMANHQSNFDVPTLISVVPGPNLPMGWVLKKSLLKFPVFGPAVKALGSVALDRSNTTESIGRLKKAAKRLKQEKLSLCIFPEGTRNRSKEKLATFKKGGFMLAMQSDIPILPIAIVGTEIIAPANEISVIAGEVAMHIMPPIPTAHLEANTENRDALMQEVRNALLSKL